MVVTEPRLLKYEASLSLCLCHPGNIQNKLRGVVF